MTNSSQPVIHMKRNVYIFNDVEYLKGSAGSLILACPKCGEEHFREPENYFWSLVPENQEWMKREQKNYWGDPSWHKCFNCETQMEPIRVDELNTKWRPLWKSLGFKLSKTGEEEYSKYLEQLTDKGDL